MKRISIGIIPIILLGIVISNGQSTPPTPQAVTRVVDWNRIESKAKDFSVSVPAVGSLVRITERYSRIYFYKNELGLRVTYNSGFHGKEWIKQFSSRSDFRDDCDSFNLDKYRLIQCGLKPSKKFKDQRQSVFLAVGSPNSYYTVYIGRESEDSEFLLNVLSSIRLNGIPVFKGLASTPIVMTEINETSLVQDDAVTKALSQPDSTQPKLEKVKQDSVAQTNSKPVKYSRPVIILEDPDPEIREFDVDNRFYGDVFLRITYLANGQIGPIGLISVSGRGAGITNSVFNAAKKIKFIPAEIDGKSVDYVDEFGSSFGFIRQGYF